MRFVWVSSYQKLFVYPSRAFRDKCGDGQLLWLRDMPILNEKAFFFKLISTIKVKLEDEMTQSPYLCVILHTKHKQLPFIAVLTWLVEKIKGFLRKAKSFRNTETYQKRWGGVPSPPPPPLNATIRIWICVCVRGLSGVVDFNSCARYCKH